MLTMAVRCGIVGASVIWQVLLAAILLIFFPNQDKSESVDSKWAALSAVTSRGHHSSSVVLDTEIMKTWAVLIAAA